MSENPSSPSPLLRTLHEQGYVVIPSFLTPSELSTLRSATQNLTSIARSPGGWPHIRSVGKQFPPWPSVAPPPEEGGIWGVQHLLHPSLPISPTDRAAFIRLYFSPKVLDIVHQLLQTGPTTTTTPGLSSHSPHAAHTGQEDDEQPPLVMELFNLLVRPDRTFSLRWHRDDIPPTATAEEELARLTAAAAAFSSPSSPGSGLPLPKYNHTQWNLPLYDDSSLILIPGSHARARTTIERDADPYAENLPGQITVHLKAGDIAFYDNDILHRGTYSPEKERMTLHGSVSCVAVATGAGAGSTKRARNVLQHGVGEWVDGCDFGAVLKADSEQRGLNNKEEEGEDDERLVKLAEGMRRRLVEMGRENQGGRDLGFSLSG